MDTTRTYTQTFTQHIICSSSTNATHVEFRHSPEELTFVNNGDVIEAKFYLAFDINETVPEDEQDGIVFVTQIIKNGELVTDELELTVLADELSNWINGEH